MLHLQIDPHSGVPVYRQVMDQVKYCVASGLISPGDQLPSIRALAKDLHVNPTTIVKAYDELKHEGTIELRQGKGAFIAEGGSKMTAREREKALRRLARQLAIEASQMGADEALVLKFVKEEIARTLKEKSHG